MVAEELGHLTARSIPWTTGLQAARACGCRFQLSHGVTYRSPPSWMKFCFRICRGALLLILFSPGGGGSRGGTHEARPREERRGLTKDVGPDSHGLLDDRRHVSLREKRSERAGEREKEAWAAGAPGSTRGAEGRACGRDQITEARGGVSRDTDRGLAGARPRGCHELNSSSGSASPVPGHLPSGAGPEAFPDTPTSSLKGPARRAFPTSRPSGARRQVCTCTHKPALFFREYPEVGGEFSSAMASPIFWKVLSFSPPPTLFPWPLQIH